MLGAFLELPVYKRKMSRMPTPGPGSAAAATAELGAGVPECVVHHCGHRRRRAAREPTTAGGTSMAAVMVGARPQGAGALKRDRVQLREPASRIYAQR